jgi:hypothetical protein
MADVKISQLNDGSPAQAGDEIPVTRGASNFKISIGDITTLATSTLGTISTQDSNNVSITGGSIAGITDLAIADGGTGAGTAAGARTNLLPPYAGNATKVLKVNAGATDVEWAEESAGGITSITAGTGLSGGTITSTGTIALATAYGDTVNPYAAKTANYVLAAPNGSSGAPTFRALVAADVPTLNQNTTGNAATATALQTARTINGVSFDGTANITVADSTKLPLAGGTMTGSISFDAGQTWPTFNQNTTGTASNVTGTVAIANGGTGATTESGARTALGVPASPTGTNTQLLANDGSGGFSNVTVGSGLDLTSGTLTATGSGSGTVTSVGLTMPSGFTVANSPVTTSGTIAVTTAISGILKGNGSGFTTATSGTDYAPATSGTSILYGNGSGGFSNVTVGTGLSFSAGTLSATGAGGSGDVVGPSSATDSQIALFDGTTGKLIKAASTTGLLKASSGVIAAAASGTDYAPATSGTSILKGSGTGGFSNASAGSDYLAPPSGTAILKANSGGALANAVAGTDYAPATSGTAILKGNGTGGFSNATAGTDYAAATTGTNAQLLANNGSGGFANVTVGSGLTLAAGTLSSTAGSGTVTSIDVSGGTTGLTTSGGPVTSTGTITLAGTLALANGGTGQTTAQSAINSLAGATTSGQFLRGNGTNVVMSAIQAADVPTLNQNTTGTASNVTGTVAVANGGTGQTSYTNGQLLIGNASGGLSKATLTAGSNVTITNGDGAITIAASGGGSSVPVSDEGTQITAGVTSFNFTGAGVTATASTGAVTVNIPGGSGSATILENLQTISSNYTITSSYNGLSAGPVTVNTGVAVTVGTGQRWLILE